MFIYLYAELHYIVSAVCLVTLKFSAVHFPPFSPRFTVFLEHYFTYHTYYHTEYSYMFLPASPHRFGNLTKTMPHKTKLLACVHHINF
jgi:hypothetical protein